MVICMTLIFLFFAAILGGLAFFLYGMNLMCNSLEKLSSTGIEKILKKSTSNDIKGFICGTGITALLQSSSTITVMLVGLVAKNAILIVEFAKVEMEKGVDAMTAAITASRLRFRPIVMTSLAFILGLIPLVISSGPGSVSRQGIGTGVFFGMCVAITAGIVFVPFFFVWMDRIKSKFRK